MKYYHICRISLLVSAAATAVSTAQAQESNPAASGTEQAEIVEGPPEIVVTAQRREQRLQDVPAAVSALGNLALKDASILLAADISRVVPNLQVYSPYGAGSTPVFTMRGVSASDYTFNHSRPIAIFLDDSVRGFSPLESMPIFDAQRVEVLRGPQGTLYGRNATGGAISIVSNVPTFETDGHLTLGYGRYNRLNLDMAAQAPLIEDKLAVRLAVNGVKADGWIKNRFPGGPDLAETQYLAGRATILFKPSSDFEAILRLHRFTSTGTIQGSLPRDLNLDILGEDLRAGLGFFEASVNYPGRMDIANSGANLTLNLDAGPYRFTSITSYDSAHHVLNTDSDGMQIELDENNGGGRKIRQFVQQLRVVTQFDGPVNFISGVEYARDSGQFFATLRFFNDPLFYTPGSGYVPTFGVPFNERNQFRQKRTNISGYIRGEVELAEGLKVSGGLRYSRDKIRASDYTAYQAFRRVVNGTPDFFDFSDILTIPSVSRRQTFSNTSFEAGVNWKIADNILTYASFKQGYRTGAVNGSAYGSPSEVNLAKPEEVDSYEAGIKTDWLDRRLQINLTGFWANYRNQQVGYFEAGAQFLYNIERARIKGFELEARANITDSFNVSASVGHQDPRYVRGSIGRVAPVSVAGKQALGAARWNVNVGADWDIVNNDDGKLRLHLGGVYTSRVFFTPQNIPGVQQDGFWLANGRIVFSPSKSPVEVAVWGTNIFNKKYTPYAFHTDPAVLGFEYYIRGEPRMYGVEATLRF
ncbi:TonB-dependent receptor [Sphingopyxis sp. 22461]|jgi:iron complex outermembrane receptor protein|uniref:TonB-dependent receptor n=1 Tax=Sphingopyxis sp. 22461 TaxID=3453923 RepID=UPI003F829A0C